MHHLELQFLQQRLADIHAAGGQLVAISPELPDKALSTREKHALEYQVLSDVGNKVADQYGLVMKIPEVIRPLYLQWGLDLPRFNGEDTWELPIPATYVLNKDGKVVSAYVNKNYSERMEPEAIIRALEII